MIRVSDTEPTLRDDVAAAVSVGIACRGAPGPNEAPRVSAATGDSRAMASVVGATSTTSTRRQLVFAGPRRVEIVRDTTIERRLEPNEVRVRSLCSGVSAGTELLLYRGQIVPDEALDATIPAYKETAGADDEKSVYPTPYGYCLCGQVVEVGASLPVERWLGKLVFLLASHAEEHIVRGDEVFIFLDDWKEPVRELVLSCPQLVSVVETVVCWLQDAAPVVGDRLAVVGAGLYGSVMALVGVRLFPSSTWLIVESLASRREQLEGALRETIGPSVRWHVIHADEVPMRVRLEPRFDIVLEASGSISGLDNALQLVRPSGRVVVGSWYGRKATEQPLGALGSTRVHRSHAQILFSQVSEIPPWLAGRYDKRRRMDIVRDILSDFWEPLALFCRNVRSFRFEEAGIVYAQLDRGALQAPVRFLYPDDHA